MMVFLPLFEALLLDHKNSIKRENFNFFTYLIMIYINFEITEVCIDPNLEFLRRV